MSADEGGQPASDDGTFVFILGSARSGGNTEAVARYAAEQLPARVSRRWIRLADYPLPGFSDHRGYGSIGHPEGNELALLEETLGATDLVIVSPLYWYSVSAATKLYLDYWSAWMELSQLEFRRHMRRKTLWAISSLSGQDPEASGPLVDMLHRMSVYLEMRWGGALVVNGTRSDRSCSPVTKDGADPSRVSRFFTIAPAAAGTPAR